MKKVVIESEIEQIYIGNIGISNIYAIKAGSVIYKLHYLGENMGVSGWGFVALNNSSDFAYGITSGSNKFDTMILAIKSVIDANKYAVYEFETQREFLEWCLK